MKNSMQAQIKILIFKSNRRIFNRKNFVLALLLFIVISIYIAPIKDLAIITGCNVTPWIYPFLISDAHFISIFVAGTIYYFSNVPFMQRCNIYCLLREGRKSWIIEQFVYIFVSAVVITSVSILMSILAIIPYVTFETGWGKVLFTLARTDVGFKVGMFLNIPSHFILNHSPLYGMCLSIVLLVIGIVFIGMLMFFASIYINKRASVLIVTGLIIYSSVVANIGNTFEKKFAMFSPVSWLRVTRIDYVEYGFSVSPSLLYILVCFISMIAILGMLIYVRCMKIDFIWENEDE